MARDTAAPTTPARRSTGRVVSPTRAALLVVEGSWVWYRRNWRSTAVTSILQPLLFLLALGFGFGSQVEPGPATGGLPYVQYLAPALVVVSAMQTAAFESTYPILSAFKWQRGYLAITATPVGPRQLVAGQLTWIALRLVTVCLAFLLVAVPLGALNGPAALLSLPVAVLTGMAVAAPIAAYAATITSEGQQFNAIFRFAVMPMMMFAGTFFPVEQLPAWTRPVVWAMPVWHGNELSRGLALGGLDPWPALGHLAFLLALFAVGAHLCTRNFTRRLAV